MILNLSAIRACRGNHSQICVPEMLVEIGSNSPRYSTGASGFISYDSMCDKPPGSQTKITDVSLRPAAVLPSARTRNRSDNASELNPRAPNCSALRRDSEPARGGPGQRKLCIVL